MHEILPDIFTWPWYSERHGYNFNGHLIRHPEGNLCIDPVEADSATLGEIAHHGVAWIVITNRNHTRACNALRERTGACTAMHPADAAHARAQGAQLDEELEPGGRIGPLHVVAAPGKSPGEIALHWPERELLVVGDAVIGNPPGRLSLLPDRVVDDPPRLRDSVRGLLTLDFDAMLVGDGVSITHNATARLRELIESFSG